MILICNDGVVEQQGHMYLFERYVCFYSNIFGYEKKVLIKLLILGGFLWFNVLVMKWRPIGATVKLKFDTIAGLQIFTLHMKTVFPIGLLSGFGRFGTCALPSLTMN